MTKEQKRAVARLNAALKNAHDNGIWLAGMDHTLLYATDDARRPYEEQNNNARRSHEHTDYCPVAMASIHSDEGSGHLYSENYDDSGGW